MEITGDTDLMAWNTNLYAMNMYGKEEDVLAEVVVELVDLRGVYLV